ncbi:MAG TPA: glycerophosphodiester phosphodiesterase, partial [Bacteroidia bacterium]|nr:glycerophosphodiester phosphodiesterase [Bacteroidia bacterium]
RHPFEIAHRGASGYLPEHTLEATAMAHGLGAAFIEQDVAMSSDGVLVVMHDITLDSVTDVAVRFPDRAREDGKFYAIDFTLDELKSLVVRERRKHGSDERAFPNRYPDDQPAFRIPTFEECLRLIGGLNVSTGRTAGVYVEIKRPAWHLAQGRDLGAAVVEMLARHGYREKGDPCYVQCFELDEVRRLRGDLGYRGRLVQLMSGSKGEGGSDFDRMRTEEGLRELAALGVDGIGPALRDVVDGDPKGGWAVTGLVKSAHAAGLEVHPYTARVDELPKWAKTYAELIEGLRAAKVDAYFTDFPGLADH